MREFLFELQSIYSQIAENQIGRLEPGLTEDEVVSSYKKIADTFSSLRLRTEIVIKDYLFPMLENVTAITDEDEEALYETAQKISSYESRADPGLALMIYQGLLEWARNKQCDAKIIKYLYWCGITLYFFSRDEQQRILGYFEEGASYADRYHTFDDPDTRKYIHRCIGNTSMSYYFMDETQKAIEVDESAFSFWNGLMFSGKDPDFPWLNYFLTCLTHRHSVLTRKVHSDPDAESKDVLKKILETAIMINKLYHKNCESFQVFGGTRYDYILWEAQFLNGLISFDMLRDNVEKKKAEFRDDDFSPDAMYVKHDLNIYLIFFAATMRKLRGKRDEVVASVSTETIDYFSKIPKSVNPREVAAQLVSSAKHLSTVFESAEQLDFVLKMTTFRHIPTYAHSIIVSRIAFCLTRFLIRQNPRCFVGFMGITRVKQVEERAEDLCRFAETSGLCHDIGKIAYITNPYIHARILTDEEFKLIKHHPDDGKTMMMREDGVLQNEGYVDVISGHHKHFDDSSGYPHDFNIGYSKHRIMIDIVAVADSIAAATDDIVRTYANPKTLNDVCMEIISEAGSRYSPVVADALKSSEMENELSSILENERGKAYYTAYLHAWS